PAASSVTVDTFCTDRMNSSTPTVAIVGARSGRITRTYVCHQVAPEVYAACSRSSEVQKCSLAQLPPDRHMTQQKRQQQHPEAVVDRTEKWRSDKQPWHQPKHDSGHRLRQPGHTVQQRAARQARPSDHVRHNRKEKWPE